MGLEWVDQEKDRLPYFNLEMACSMTLCKEKQTFKVIKFPQPIFGQCHIS